MNHNHDTTINPSRPPTLVPMLHRAAPTFTFVLTRVRSLLYVRNYVHPFVCTFVQPICMYRGVHTRCPRTSNPETDIGISQIETYPNTQW